jgi:hypothetical protein
MVGDVQSFLLNKIGVPEKVQKFIRPATTQELRSGIDVGIDKLGGDEAESAFAGGEGTLRGRALEFGGSSLTFGAPGLGRTLMQEGAKAFAKSTTRNFVGSNLAGGGSFVGEEVGNSKGCG